MITFQDIIELQQYVEYNYEQIYEDSQIFSAISGQKFIYVSIASSEDTRVLRVFDRNLNQFCLQKSWHRNIVKTKDDILLLNHTKIRKISLSKFDSHLIQTPTAHPIPVYEHFAEDPMNQVLLASTKNIVSIWEPNFSNKKRELELQSTQAISKLLIHNDNLMSAEDHYSLRVRETNGFEILTQYDATKEFETLSPDTIITINSKYSCLQLYDLRTQKMVWKHRSCDDIKYQSCLAKADKIDHKFLLSISKTLYPFDIRLNKQQEPKQISSSQSFNTLQVFNNLAIGTTNWYLHIIDLNDFTTKFLEIS